MLEYGLPTKQFSILKRYNLLLVSNNVVSRKTELRKLNPEKYKETRRKYESTERFKKLKAGYDKKYRESNNYKKYNSDYQLKESTKQYNRNYRHMIKNQVFLHYGNGVPQCSCCGELEMVFLTIDHIDGREKYEHKYRNAGYKLYAWLIKNNFPDGFQILCWNCNWAKHRLGSCPHQHKDVPVIHTTPF